MPERVTGVKREGRESRAAIRTPAISLGLFDLKKCDFAEKFKPRPAGQLAAVPSYSAMTQAGQPHWRQATISWLAPRMLYFLV